MEQPWDTRSAHQWRRSIRKEAFSVVNRMRSALVDAGFVKRVAGAMEGVPVYANLSCGQWYVPPEIQDGTCYFKSGDMHDGHWRFSTQRHNLHLLRPIAEAGAIIIVDSTRQGKRFPDSLSKTVPVWSAVLKQCMMQGVDSDLLLPHLISDQERAAIQSRIPEWVQDLSQQTALANCIDEWRVYFRNKPLRCLWVHPTSDLEEVVRAFHCMTPSFHVVVCLSASEEEHTIETRSRQGWHYIQGAGDDEDNWCLMQGRRMSTRVMWSCRDMILDTAQTQKDIETVLVEQSKVPKADTTATVLLSSCMHGKRLSFLLSCSNSLDVSKLESDGGLVLHSSHLKESLPPRWFTALLSECKSQRKSLEKALDALLSEIESHAQEKQSITMQCIDISFAMALCVVAAYIVHQQTTSHTNPSKQSILHTINALSSQVPSGVVVPRRYVQQLNRYFCRPLRRKRGEWHGAHAP